jgi:hydrogenase nickel incorporation protein HypA/HybF
MHELGITQEVVAIATRHAGGARIRRIVLEIGKLSAVLPDAVRFCFELCAQDTLAEGAELEIIETPGLARCRACAAEVALEQPFGRCACGGTDLEWLSGEELRVRELELT